MKTLKFARKIPIDSTWDVVVVGGGPSGCAAATAAAREGCRTMLIEATGSLGGMGTSGLMTTWAPISDRISETLNTTGEVGADKETLICGGLAQRVIRETKKAMPHMPKNRWTWLRYNPEHLKRLYEHLILSSGANLLFNTSICAVETDGHGVITSVIASGKSGLRAFQAKVFVDCTGDGDLAAFAGAEFEKGASKTGEMQPATLCFLLANVNTDIYLRGPRLNPDNPKSPIFKILKSRRYPHIKDTHVCNAMLWPGVVTFNSGHVWNVDGTDPESVSRGLVEGRLIAEEFRAALAKFCPDAFGNAILVATGSSLGIRETRRILGDYVLSLKDYSARRTFSDEIGRNNYWIDIHTGIKEDKKSHQAWAHVQNRYMHYKSGESHGIPYRCLTPKGLRNLLVAGRCISCDRPVQGAIRTQPTCLVTGEAAGAAAAQTCRRKDGDVHAVDTDKLRKRLKTEGAYLPDVK